MSVLVWLGVALLGGVGALLRFRLDSSIQRRFGGEFPLGTLAVNVLGSFCLGLLTGLSVTGDALLLEGTATLGSFTTFSTWMLEAERSSEEGEIGIAGANVAVSLAGGIVAAILGWLVGAAL
ncbi:MAG TPA: fluoride efflux transporter CrcB [Gaiellaceae bacterium]|nr:fluoride efflux transporter CrcB [Gaiellaceae bacterium]